MTKFVQAYSFCWAEPNEDTGFLATWLRASDSSSVVSDLVCGRERDTLPQIALSFGWDIKLYVPCLGIGIAHNPRTL